MRGTLSFALWNSGMKHTEKQTQEGLPLGMIPQDQVKALHERRRQSGCAGSRAGGLNVRGARRVTARNRRNFFFFFVSEETLVPEI